MFQGWVQIVPPLKILAFNVWLFFYLLKWRLLSSFFCMHILVSNWRVRSSHMGSPCIGYQQWQWGHDINSFNFLIHGLHVWRLQCMDVMCFALNQIFGVYPWGNEWWNSYRYRDEWWPWSIVNNALSSPSASIWVWHLMSTIVLDPNWWFICKSV